MVGGALDAGIKVATLDRKGNVAVSLQVGALNELLGEQGSVFLVEKLGSTGAII